MSGWARPVLHGDNSKLLSSVEVGFTVRLITTFEPYCCDADDGLIVNRTLIAGTTNRKISKKSPSDYLRSILPDDHREAILDSHLVDAEARAALEEDDHEAFLAAREQALTSKIRQLVS